MCSIHFGKLAINRQLLSAFLAFLFGFVASVLANEPPDLSKLTESEKNRGLANFKLPNPRKSRPQSPKKPPKRFAVGEPKKTADAVNKIEFTGRPWPESAQGVQPLAGWF